MKRVIKIILILLAVFLLTLGIIWLVGRHSAQKNGKTPLTFRQFLGLSTKSSPANTIPGSTDTSLFTSPGAATAGGDGTGSNGTNGKGAAGKGFNENTQVSQFTNKGISLTNGANVGLQTTTAIGSNKAAGDNSTITSTSATSTAPVCSDADTTISFTADELAQLNQLQNRFYAIAQTLHTDADVATEIANHDAFAVKADQVTELYNYCASKLPLITDPRLQQHVATPFWNDSSTDSLTFLSFANDPAQFAHLSSIHDNNPDNKDTTGIKGPYGLLSFSSPQAVPITGSAVKGSNPDFSQLIPVVEKILRINLW
jgi:hypothetical protein